MQESRKSGFIIKTKPMRIKLVTAVLAMLTLSGCIARMDPYKGGTGTRVNINGEKFVMVGVLGSASNSIYTRKDGSYEYKASVFLRHLMESRSSQLEITITSSSPITEGKKYDLGTSSSAKAFLTWMDLVGKEPYFEIQESGSPIPLKGWLIFDRIGEKDVEARFELDSKSGDKVVVRHAFLRLWTTFNDEGGGQ